MMRNASASQLKAFVACVRKWWWQWPKGLKPKPSRGMLTGSALHKELEVYLKGGELPPTRLARMYLDLLPKPGSLTMEVERRIKLEDSAVPTIGYIDVIDLGSKVVQVIDHKFLSALKYAKCDAEIPFDLQMQIYGHWACQEFNLPSVVLTHYSYRTRGAPMGQVASAELNAGYLQARWDEHKTTIERMTKLYLPEAEAASIPCAPSAPNNPACRAYGGCPHQSACALIVDGKRSLFRGIGTMSISKRKEAREGAIREGFARLPECDQRRLLKGATVTSIEQIIDGKWAERAHATIELWLRCASPDDLREVVAQLGVDAAAAWYGLESHMLRAHPSERQTEHERLVAEVALKDAQIQRKADQERLVVAQPAKEPADLLREMSAEPSAEELATHSGIINPPDAAPNAIPVPPDPRLRPVTDVEGVGDVLADRLSEALSMDGVRPSIMQVAEALRSDFTGLVKRVRGLSKTKAQAIVDAVAEEPMLMDSGLGGPAPRATEKEPSHEESPETSQDAPQPAEKTIPAQKSRAADTEDNAIELVSALDAAHDQIMDLEGQVNGLNQALLEKGFSLYVDCIPSERYVRLEELLEQYQRRVEEAEGVIHYGLVDYGRGPTAVAGLLRADLDELGSSRIVATSGPLMTSAIEVLAQRAVIVVRGVSR